MVQGAVLMSLRQRVPIVGLALHACLAGTLLGAGAGAGATTIANGSPTDTAHAAHAHRCGSVRARNTSFNVGILAGHTSCKTARYVVRYVLEHGPITQGAPGKSPHGWSCGWGYGRTSDGQNQRGGPNCQRGSTFVEGIEAKLRPYF